MQADVTGNRCLTYVSVPHLGFGWVQGCVSILENFPTDELSATIVLPRAFRAISPSVHVKQAIPSFAYRYASMFVHPALDYCFRSALAAADPRNTIAYFWPEPPISLVRYARDRGFLTVREMINRCAGAMKSTLDDAYHRLGLSPDHNKKYSAKNLQNECEELRLHDYILSPNPIVEKSLIETGINPKKILRSTYGWSPAKFSSSVREESGKFRALFIGADTVRKGVPQLLAAWKKSGVVGELLIVGEIHTSLKPLLAPYLEGGDVRLVRFEYDLGRLYKSADVFVFPSLEEGDPQVTYEAAGCGLPLITTLMGGANIIKDGVNGLLVNPHDVDGLAEAISRLANSVELRKRLGLQAAKDAQNYTYEKIGVERARMLSGLLGARHEING